IATYSSEQDSGIGLDLSSFSAILYDGTSGLLILSPFIFSGFLIGFFELVICLNPCSQGERAFQPAFASSSSSTSLPISPLFTFNACSLFSYKKETYNDSITL